MLSEIKKAENAGACTCLILELGTNLDIEIRIHLTGQALHVYNTSLVSSRQSLCGTSPDRFDL